MIKTKLVVCVDGVRMSEIKTQMSKPVDKDFNIYHKKIHYKPFMIIRQYTRPHVQHYKKHISQIIFCEEVTA